MKKVARLRIAHDEQFVPPGVKINPEQTNVRTTGRIKKPKAVFDPSDNYMPRSQRLSIQQPASQPKSPPAAIKSGALLTSSPSPSTNSRRERSLSTGSNTSNTSISLQTNTDEICSVCLKREPRRGGNYKNKLVSCIDCGKRVHKLCTGVDFLESAPLRLNFKCESCKTCEICSGSATHGAVTCSKCCKSYHVGCHIPKISKVYTPERSWKCNKCQPNESSGNTLVVVGNKNSSFNNNSVMPVKIIRQIIGDNANLTNMTQKTEIAEKLAKDQIKAPPQEPIKIQQQSNALPSVSSLQHHQNIKTKLQGHLQDNNNKISEVVRESTVKVSALRKKRNDSTTTSSSSCDDSDDEDFKYVEKKKQRLNNHEPNNNQHSKNRSSDTSLERKPIISNFAKKSVDDLPKREVIKAWSVEQVMAYIKEYFPNEAYVFKEHEIDGNALLLLKRSDVIKSLPLKLGPSLRLYNLILQLQTQTLNDPTLGWECSSNVLHSTE